jgi:hypothetical protein
MVVHLQIVVGLREMANALIVPVLVVQVEIQIVILAGNVRVLTQVVVLVLVMIEQLKFVAEMNVIQLFKLKMVLLMFVVMLTENIGIALRLFVMMIHHFVHKHMGNLLLLINVCPLLAKVYVQNALQLDIMMGIAVLVV